MPPSASSKWRILIGRINLLLASLNQWWILIRKIYPSFDVGGPDSAVISTLLSLEISEIVAWLCEADTSSDSLYVESNPSNGKARLVAWYVSYDKYIYINKIYYIQSLTHALSHAPIPSDRVWLKPSRRGVTLGLPTKCWNWRKNLLSSLPKFKP